MLAGVVRNTGRLYSRNFCPSPPQVESGKGHRFEKKPLQSEMLYLCQTEILRFEVLNSLYLLPVVTFTILNTWC